MKTLEELIRLRNENRPNLMIRLEKPEVKIVIEAGTAAIAAGARKITQVALEEIKDLKMQVNVVYEHITNQNASHPMVIINKKGENPVKYGNVNTETMKTIIKEHVVNNHIVTQLVCD